jgi:hypothetical protein
MAGHSEVLGMATDIPSFLLNIESLIKYHISIIHSLYTTRVINL